MVRGFEVGADAVRGDVDEGYGRVADVFRSHFAAGTEIGSSLAVFREGRPVVDLWCQPVRIRSYSQTRAGLACMW